MGIGSAYAVGTAPSLQTLHDRVRKLETRVAAHEEDRGTPAGESVANRVRAPFVVVDAKDRPIVTIDASGDANANLALSRARATAVHAALVKLDAALAPRLQADGYGAARPKVDNRTLEGRAQNRRVELVLP